ncbi:MAG: magnesium transporter [Planctomycetes bacterium]|nr:magnesium transporter [Planctomycetota bacterium]
MIPDKESFHSRLVVALEVTGDDKNLAQALSQARAADIAESFEVLGEEERSRILFALPPHTAAEVVIMLDEAVRGDVIEEMDTESITEIVSELTPDDAADMLGELPSQESEEILEHMPDEVADRIEELLEYDESTAGGIMTPDVVVVPASATVSDAVEQIRQATYEEELNEVFIVDANRKLVGTVPLRRLVTNPPSTRLSDICDSDPVTVEATDDQETVVQIIRKYDVMEAAVVDADGRLLGRITHDDLLDVAEEEAAEDFLRMGGTDAAELESSSIAAAARIRLMFLLPSMLVMLLTATVLFFSKPQFPVGLFAALVLFVPMIGATGGNAGIQITTVIVRGFATGELASTKLVRALAREGRIALFMAPICGLLAWGCVRAFFPFFMQFDGGVGDMQACSQVALAVGVAMTLAILVAASFGIALPFSFRRLGVDPAVASGPLVTTMNDVLSVSIYMGVAMWIAL